MSKYSVRKPVTVLMCILIVVVLGVYSLTRQSLGLFPEMNLPYVVVVTPYPGASAEDVVDDVTSVVETQVTSMNNFYGVSSTSNQHYSIVMVEFNEGTNMDSVMIDLRSKLDNVTFPEGASKPTILQISPDMLPVMTVSVTVDYPEEKDEEQAFIKASQYVNMDVIDRLSRVEGVAEVSTTGAADVMVKIDIDSSKLEPYGYTTDQIIDLIEEQNQNKLIGVALNNGEICMLHLGNEIQSLDELRNLPIPLKKADGQIEAVKLSDLAKDDGIKFIDNNVESYSKVNGKKTISLSFQMQNGAVITDVTKGITEALDEIKTENANFNYEVVLDQGEYINLAVGSVVENLIYGAILAVVVLLLFLRDFRPTLIVGLSIPISVIATFMCMYFMGINLNMLSMGGLALGIGMLVDNAIVVIENIFRLRKLGKSKTEAAIEGAKGVASAIISSTITTIIVFVPILFIEGMVKDVFENMAYTIAFSLICSLIIALTMVPAMASKILKDDKEENKEEGVAKIEKENKIMKKYDKVIRWSLNHKLIVILIPILLFVVTLVLTVSKGFVLLPTTDEGSININIEMDSDLEFSTISKYTDELVEDIRQTSDEIESVSAKFGASTGLLAMVSSSNDNDVTNVTITVKLDKDHKTSTEDHANNIQKVIENYNKESGLTSSNIYGFEVAASEGTLNSLTTTGFNVKVKGHDLEKLEAVANKLASITREVEGLTKVTSGVSGSKNNLKIYVNKENAAKVGLTQQDFIDSINLFLESDSISFATGTEGTIKVEFNGNEYELSLPSSMNIIGISLDNLMELFGSYEEFLDGFVVLDSEMVELIKASGLNFYNPMPYDKDGNLIINFNDPEERKKIRTLKMEVNPLIYYHEETKTVLTPFDAQAKAAELQQEITDLNNKLLTASELDIEIIKEQINEKTSLLLSYANIKPITNYIKGKLLGDESDPNHISTVLPITGYTSISSDGKYKYFSVTGDVLKDYNVTKVSDEAEKVINEYLNSKEFDEYRDFVQVEFVGENEEIMEVVEQMILALLIGVLLVYMVIAIQFQSLSEPLIILGTLPLAFTGGLAFILIFNMEFSIVAIMGLIVLVGVAVNNGIVLIDYVKQLREDGMTIKEACVEASKTRLRPILMTSLTTIVALIFSAIGASNGSELLQPLSLTSIGGLLFSTILTLIVVPAMYMVFNYKTVKKEEAELNKEE